MATYEFGEKRRLGDSTKVYTRRKHTKRLKKCQTADKTAVSAGDSTSAATSPAVGIKETSPVTGNESDITNNQENINDGEKCDYIVSVQPSQTLGTHNGNWQEQKLELDDLSSHNQPDNAANGKEVIKPVVVRVDDRVRINLARANSREEIWELRRKLVSELEEVRVLAKQLEAKEVELTSIFSNTAAAYSISPHSENNVIARTEVMGANPEVASVRQPKLRPFRPRSTTAVDNNGFASAMENSGFASVMENNDFAGRNQLIRVNSELNSVVSIPDYRPFPQLSVSVMDNNKYNGHGFGEFLEKEKRTPKANQYYRNSDFLLAKDRLPPESNRKGKPGTRRKHGGQLDYASGIDRFRNQAFKNCSNLLQRLMKHKHGWVFNEPVNAKLLGLHDYHNIIIHPMDLGTIKTRLAQYCYKSPAEFAEDVRLTFLNAMTYNPKGHDVHVMAEQLSNIFEEKWAVIESEYSHEWRYEMSHYAGLSTPTSRKVVPTPPTSLPVLPKRNMDRSDYTEAPVDFRPNPSIVPVVRTPAPKKPKAKDPNKRDMTFDEKRKLRTNLQSLPPEKINAVVQIIKRSNSVHSEHDDEVEVDIDNFDAETLWELDRVFTNYKKSLSKHKRRAELAQAKAQARQAIPAPNMDSVVTVAAKESKTDEMKVTSKSLVQTEKQGDNVSSSSSSSSSDSGSSSSDSDSDSSSS